MAAAAVKLWIPRPFQPIMYEFALALKRCALLVPMGFGKSSVVLWLIDTLLIAGEVRKVLILAPLRVARTTWPDEAKAWSNFAGLRIATVIGTEKERLAALATPADIYTSNYEQIIWLIDTLGDAWDFDMVVLDECFVSGTLISTQQGLKHIECLKAGDEVLTLIGPRKVNHVHRKTSQALVRVYLSNGKEVVCTPTHLFRVEDRWVEAQHLAGHTLVRDSGVQILRDGLRNSGCQVEISRSGPVLQSLMWNESVDSRKAEVVVSGACCGWAGPLGQSQRRLEHWRPDARVDALETVRDHEGPRRSVHGTDSWRQRDRDERVRVHPEQGTCPRMGLEHADRHQNLDSFGVGRPPFELQTGLHLAGTHDLPGSRRGRPHVETWEVSGRKKDDGAGSVRVDRVENIECRSPVEVWDIEVDEAHHYFAGGCLVHNCTRLKGFRLRQGTKRAKALSKVIHTKVKRFVALSGTPAPNGLQDLWALGWFIDRGQRLGLTFSAFENRWFGFQRGVNPMFAKRVAFAHAQDEIQNALRDVCLTLSVKDWFDISEPIVNTIRITLPPKARQHYREMERDLFTKLAGHEIEAFGAAAKTMKTLQMANGAAYVGDSNTQWEVLHDEKIEALRSVIEEASGAPVLVVYNFRSDLARLQKAFPEGRVLDAASSTVEQWNAGTIPILFTHPASAGHGLSLQHGGNILAFFSVNWNLEEHSQVIERIGPVRQRQSGYDRPVFIHYIIAADTIDESVLDRLRSKRSVQDVLLEALKRHTNDNGIPSLV